MEKRTSASNFSFLCLSLICHQLTVTDEAGKVFPWFIANSAALEYRQLYKNLGSNIKPICSQSQYWESHTNHSRPANHFSQATFPLWTRSSEPWRCVQSLRDLPPSSQTGDARVPQSLYTCRFNSLSAPLPSNTHSLMEASDKTGPQDKGGSPDQYHMWEKRAKLCPRGCWSTENERASFVSERNT